MDNCMDLIIGADDIFADFEGFEIQAQNDAASLQSSWHCLPFDERFGRPNRMTTAIQRARHDALVRTVKHHLERGHEFILEFDREIERVLANLHSIRDAKSRLCNEATLRELLPGELAVQELREKLTLYGVRASRLMGALDAALGGPSVGPALVERHPASRKLSGNVSSAGGGGVGRWPDVPTRPTLAQELESLLKTDRPVFESNEMIKG